MSSPGVGARGEQKARRELLPVPVAPAQLGSPCPVSPREVKWGGITLVHFEFSLLSAFAFSPDAFFPFNSLGSAGAGECFLFYLKLQNKCLLNWSLYNHQRTVQIPENGETLSCLIQDVF